MRRVILMTALIASLLLNSCSRDDNSLIVLSLSSLNGNVFPVKRDGEMHGGISLFSSQIKKLTDNPEHSMDLIANSNFVYGTKEAYFTGGKAVIDLMNQLSFSCLIVGHREFYFGFDKLRQLSEIAEFPFLSANIEYADSTEIEFIEPYIILKDNRSALIGISTKKVIKANLQKDVDTIRLKDPSLSVIECINDLKSKGVENIIVAGDFDFQSGSMASLSKENSENLFAIDEVDLFLTTSENGKENDLLSSKRVLNCKKNGFQAVSFRITEKGIHSYDKHKISSGVLKPDPVFSNRMAEIFQIVNSISGKVVGTASEDILHSSRDKFTKETPLGNLICDIMREYAETDIFLMNSGKVRNGFEKGSIILGDLYNIMPYEGRIVTVAMNGSQVLRILESSTAFKMSKSFLQVSGIEFEFDSSRKPFSRIVENSVRINRKPLDKEKVYSVSLTDYIFQGGDAYTEFGEMGIMIKKVHQKHMREIIRDHISKQTSIRYPENNRITDISKK